MSLLPLLLDAEDALEHFSKGDGSINAELALIVGILSKDGYSNTRIRELLDIDKVYLVTHLIRVGLSYSIEELQLWHNNPAISFGHMRAIAKLPRDDRETLLRNHLSGPHRTVASFEAIARGKEVSSVDIKRFEQAMGETLGRDVKVIFNQRNNVGSIKLSFFRLSDLSDISTKLGFTPGEDF